MANIQHEKYDPKNWVSLTGRIPKSEYNKIVESYTEFMNKVPSKYEMVQQALQVFKIWLDRKVQQKEV